MELLGERWQTEDLLDSECRCGETIYRKKALQMETCSRTLVLHLKRWEERHWPKFHTIKHQTDISFDFLLPLPERAVPYELLAVVVHHGQVRNGHYTAFIKSTDQNWYHCDDRAPPQRVSPAKALAAQAYLMFYE